MRVAGIDIGTLTCRLLIGEVGQTGPVAVLHSDRKILRLGEGVDRNKYLKPEAIRRVIETLKEWSRVIEGHSVDASIIVATSAVRDSRNREEFLLRVKHET